MTLTRVESFCEKRDSSRVTIFLNVTRVESESQHIVTRVESLTRVTLSLFGTSTAFSVICCLWKMGPLFLDRFKLFVN